MNAEAGEDSLAFGLSPTWNRQETPKERLAQGQAEAEPRFLDSQAPSSGLSDLWLIWIHGIRTKSPVHLPHLSLQGARPVLRTGHELISLKKIHSFDKKVTVPSPSRRLRGVGQAGLCTNTRCP